MMNYADNSYKIVLDLCGGSGAWSRPYQEATDKEGNFIYDVRLITLPGQDVRNYQPPPNVYGILAAPPCQCFSRVSARWWPSMDETGKTCEAIAVFKRCWEICQEAIGFWALENPPGRHSRLIPELDRPTWQFQPYHFGDDWVKQTYLWGRFNMPWPTNFVKPRPTKRAPSGHTQGRIARLPSSSPLRSITPPGFASAFFKMNR